MRHEKKGLFKYVTWKKILFFFLIFLSLSILPDIIVGKPITTIVLLKDMTVSALGALFFSIVKTGHR